MMTFYAIAKPTKSFSPQKYQSFHVYFCTPPMKISQPLLPIEVAFTALAWFFPFMFCYHVKSNSSHRLELAITHRTQVHFYLLFLIMNCGNVFF